jgi:isoquinoline 1-oxidoreductase beta subunit
MAPTPTGKDATTPRPGADSPQPDPKLLLDLLDFVIAKSGWTKPLGVNPGRGIAVWQLHDTYLAQVSEVTVSNDDIRVNRVITALDCGQAINLNGVKAQIEGGILFALSAALKEQITVTGGAIQQQNFNSYALLRITDSPALETYVRSSARPPGGIGEAGVPGIAPSVANAVFAASGKRLRRLPFDLNRDHI